MNFQASIQQPFAQAAFLGNKPRGLALQQRQGFLAPALTYVNNHAMFKMASQEVLGSNIPLTLSASSPDEMKDQALFQFSDSLNAFGLTLLLNVAMRQGTDALLQHWGHDVNALTHNQHMWRRTALSLPIYTWLIGMEFFGPILRNMVTLHRTQEVDFSKITNVAAHKKGGKDSEDYKRYVAEREMHKRTPSHQALVRKRMNEYKHITLVDAAITLPTMALTYGLALAGLRKGWKMPKLPVHMTNSLNGWLGKASPQEAVWKKGLRKGSMAVMENLFGRDVIRSKTGSFDLIDQALMPEGDWSKISPLMCTVVWMLPTYAALMCYSRDDLEKPEIMVRAAACVLANLVFANAAEHSIDRWAAGKKWPLVGDDKNIGLLARLVSSTVLYTLLPVIGIRVTRHWRAKHLEAQKAQGLAPPQQDHLEPVSNTEAYAKIMTQHPLVRA